MGPMPISGTIQVDMEVTRYKEFKEDGAVQIWGYVGDYEASIWLPMVDQRVQALLGQNTGGPGAKRNRRKSR
jgi:hypothetical protein